MSSRGLGADKNLPVLKSNHIRRPWQMEKPAVNAAMRRSETRFTLTSVKLARLLGFFPES